MKSIIQQASSIAKAIEQGWNKAGKPNSFSIKIFEHPEHNFLGMSRKPAKIGIFYESPKERAVKKPVQKRVVHKKERAPRVTESSFWTQELLDEASQWLKGALKEIKRDSVPFETTPKDHLLRITFAQSILNDGKKDQQLFRSFAILLLQTLRNRFKRPLRGFKVHISQK